MDYGVLREALRRARLSTEVERDGVRRKMTLNDAADASGLNRSTIHAIENVRREPLLRPELDTIERLVAAYGLTLSSFFAQVEHVPTTLADSPQDRHHAALVTPDADGRSRGSRADTTSAIEELQSLVAAFAQRLDPAALAEAFGRALADYLRRESPTRQPVPDPRPARAEGRAAPRERHRRNPHR